MSDWTEELKQQVIEKYEAAEPTGVTSPEIVAALAEEFDKTANGVRMILSKAGVYIKKDPAAKSATAAKSGAASTRINKAQAIQDLKDAIEATGQEIDESIVDKLTGKAAQYFKSLIAEDDAED